MREGSNHQFCTATKVLLWISLHLNVAALGQMFPCARIHCQRSKCVSQASDQEIQEQPEEMHEWSQPGLNQRKMTIPYPGMQGATAGLAFKPIKKKLLTFLIWKMNLKSHYSRSIIHSCRSCNSVFKTWNNMQDGVNILFCNDVEWLLIIRP